MLAGMDDAGVFEFADLADQAAAANQDLALAAGVAGKGLAHQVHQRVLVQLGRRLQIEVLACLVPDSASEIDVLFFVGIPYLARNTKEVGLLDAHAHVIDCGFLLVAHCPAHLLVRQTLQGGLLDLHLDALS